ncbi:PREDICTED: LOW QUALITY PROTEIN: leukocyte immunoglobulin-like receptor subfamily A member 6, partial [Galeopterus variegatus]|uniref:LOW QUALITY PROTEIN: leukocyte immunoglobulin-like receptor subfamily A member 6 n=1 Tax=Galeopterus variegatus TaxID=482537 RepID=A0ABM0Q1B1_GALVR
FESKAKAWRSPMSQLNQSDRGNSWNSRIHSFPGSLPNPFIWPDPDPMVTKGSPVTIWCQGSPQADVYHLCKGRDFQPLDTQVLQNFSNKAVFSNDSMSPHTAGLYQCAYHSSNHLSEWSDPLPLLVTGLYNPLSLSAHPSPVVVLGGNVILLCRSQFTLDTFHLLKEGGAGSPRHMESQVSHGWSQAIFPVGPMNTTHEGTYRCYGSWKLYPYVCLHPSDALHLNITVSLALQCHSYSSFDRFMLTRMRSSHPTPSALMHNMADFHLGPVSHTSVDQYRCFDEHNLSYLWSVVPPQRLHLLDITSSGQANFTLSPVTSAHRCLTASHSQDYTVENLIWIDMAILILVVLGVLLLEA